MQDVVEALKALDVPFWIDEAAIERMLEARSLGRRVGIAEAKDGEVVVSVENGEKEAYMVLEPAYGGLEMTRDDVERAFAHKGVRMGIDYDAVEQALARKPYGTRVLVARFKEPVHGQDAVIEYLFRTRSVISHATSREYRSDACAGDLQKSAGGWPSPALR